MINHRACEQLISFYNNLKMMSLEQAKRNLVQNVYTMFNVVLSFQKGALVSTLQLNAHDMSNTIIYVGIIHGALQSLR